MGMLRIRRREQEFGYELFIAAISILATFNGVLAFIPGLDPDAVNVVLIVNSVLTLLFINDLVLRFATAPSRSSFFLPDYGWADPPAVIPRFRIFKAYRLVHEYGMGISSRTSP